MLSSIKFIQNIGRFETARPAPGTSYNRTTLIFGENGWGKSTLADILRSLTSNNPDILKGRKTLASYAEQKAVLGIDTQLAVYENNAWNGPRPRIAVYDSAFVNDNVFSGDIVSTDHLKKQYGLVIGEEGVRLVQHIVKLDDENRTVNAAIKSVEDSLKATLRGLGLPAMTLKDFLDLENRADIGDAIVQHESKVQHVKRAGEIQAAPAPSLFPSITETPSLQHLLISSIDDIAEEALAKVRAHVIAHGCLPTSPEDGSLEAAHEGWLETGIRLFATEDFCPFCGQRLNDRTLVDTYKDFFSDRYKDLAKSVKKARSTLARYTGGDFRDTIARTTSENEKLFQYWKEAGSLAFPDIKYVPAAIDTMEDAAARLDVLLAAKQANLTEALTGDEVAEALAEWEKGRKQFAAANEEINPLLASINSLKESINLADLPRLQSQQKLLRAVKHRHGLETKNLVEKLHQLRGRKKAIAKEKAEQRTTLNEHGRKISADLGEAINSYLSRLAAGFRIEYQEPSYQTKEPSANYNILIKDVPVSPRSALDEVNKPSFRNTLSGGDKSTLALALFLAKVNADPKLSKMIVVLDDPFTSLDHFRRQFTAIEIRKLSARARQTIVLSHDKNFLRLLWEKIDQNTISSLALQTGAPGITTIAPYNIEAATQPRYVTERMQIEEFVEGEEHDPIYIRTRLRTVCEDFYRKGDPALFNEAASLEEIVRRLESAPDDHVYKGALEELRDINEYSRGDSHAPSPGNPTEETSIEELKEFCRRVLDLTRGL